jgi:hypothetical protein
MGCQPTDHPPTPAELALGSRIATALWLTAGTVLALLLGWSLEAQRLA